MVVLLSLQKIIDENGALDYEETLTIMKEHDPRDLREDLINAFSNLPNFP